MKLADVLYSNGNNVTIENYLPHLDQEYVVRSIFADLTRPTKRISSMHFYDEKGSKLFEEITGLPEYYPTRVEKKLLREIAKELMLMSAPADIVELGSGDCSKISILLEEVSAEQELSLRYVPVDISYSAIQESANHLCAAFPELIIRGIVGDFLKHLNYVPRSQKRLFCFFGSTLGNFTNSQATNFCQKLAAVMNERDDLLLGVDMVKSPEVMERAYNDARGVTADFNRNILNVINNRAETDFNIEDFEHVAFYRHTESRVEMHLKAKRKISVRSPLFCRDISIAENEMIHTENSHKFTQERLQQIAFDAGLCVEKIYQDDQGWFSLVKLKKRTGSVYV